MKKLLLAFFAVALLATGCNSTKSVDNQTSTSIPVTQNTIPAPAPTQISEWETYTTYGFEFQYNPKWRVSEVNTSSASNDSQPFLLVWAGTVSDKPCQDLGCPPKSGDREVFEKGDTTPGGIPIYPFYKVLKVRGTQWVSVQVTDVNKSCATQSICQKYLATVPLDTKEKVSGPDYQTYNDFIDLISTFKFTK